LVRRYEIVPTPVGVNRLVTVSVTSTAYCPHARGGEPTTVPSRRYKSTLSPRPWG